MIKVLVVNTVPTERNGITNVIFNLLRAMDKSDMRIDMVAINEPSKDYADEAEGFGGEIFVVERSIRHPFRYKKELCRLIEKNGYDVIHVHGNSSTMALEMSAAKKAGCAVRIAHAHSTGCKHKILHRLLKKAFLRDCTLGLACGDAAGKFLYGDRPFTVINNGIDIKRFAFSESARREIGEKTGTVGCKVVGHVGAFAEVKNQAFLIDVIDELRKIDESYRLMLVGDGALREKVSQKAKDVGVDKYVVFTGEVSDTEKYLSAFDVSAMPSLFEGMPLSLIEAQASGLDCVVSENVTRQVNITGNVVFESLESGAAHWAKTIIEHIGDDRSLASARAEEKIKAAGYDIFTEAEKLKALYRSAVNASPNKSVE